MPLLAALLVAGFALAPQQAPRADTVEAIEHIDFMLFQRYRTASTPGGDLGRRRDALGQAFDALCDGDRDDVCFADDPDAGRCPNFVQCHPQPRRLIGALLESAERHPDSGYLMGQAIYMLGKLDRLKEAMDLADACEADAWWCDALRGYVLHGLARDEEADAAMRAFVRAAPDSVACAYTDATWVLGRWSQRGAATSVPDAYEDADAWDCARRRAVADTIWWLADPLYSVPGNDRWVEHVARSLGARFHDEIRRTLPGSPGTQRHLDKLWAARVRRGMLDSYDSRRRITWTSQASARWHFVPDVEPDDLSEPVWRLDADLDDEGYTPGAGPFVPIPHQVARFRRGDSLHVAAAARTAGTRIAGALDGVAAFVLSAGPDAAPIGLSGDVRDPVTRFLGGAPSRRYVSGIEVVTSKGVGWHRAMLDPIESGPALSDLLFYDPPDEGEPKNVVDAAAAMLGSATLRQDAQVGVYWEAYGAPAGATLEIELAVERASGGLVDRLRRLLPGGPEEGRGRIIWTEPAQGPTHSGAVTVDLRDLDGGTYTLVLRVGWEGRPPVQRRRTFEVS